MVYLCSNQRFHPGKVIEKPYLRCFSYALINNIGEDKVFAKNYNTQWETKYYELNFDKNILNTLADSLLNLDSYNILKRNKDIHDDGSTITIRINKGNISKTVRFIDYLDSNNKIYLNFYHYFESLSKEKNYILTNDTSILLKRKNEFLTYSFKMDTLIYPPPPLPLNPIKYAPPIIAKEHHKHPKKG